MIYTQVPNKRKHEKKHENEEIETSTETPFVISPQIITACKSDSLPVFAEKLMCEVFGPDQLATHSITGKVYGLQKKLNMTPKPALDNDKLKAVRGKQ